MTFVREHILDGTPEDVIARYESLGDVAEHSDFGVLDSNVVIIDTETTGLSFNHDELIQIAAARLEGGKAVDWYVTFVDPGTFLSEDIINLTGIHDEDLIGAPPPEEALAGLVEFAGDAIMVAHNAEFDRTFVTKHPAGYPLLENVWLDSLDLSRIVLPRLRSHRLIDLVRAFDAPVSTHRADDDVAATCVIYRILLAGITQMPLPLVRYIGTMAPRAEWPTGYAFAAIAELLSHAEDGGGDAIPVPDVRDDTSVPGVESATPGMRSATPGMEPTTPGTEVAHTGRHLLSVRNMRSRRVSALPTRKPRKDADELVGQLAFPTEEQIARAFSPEGLLGQIYPDYEARREQLAMADAIRNAFEDGKNLVVEAGTGVGKSMAYLVTSALFARENGVAVGVATKTNSLLDQLVYQELPALAVALQQEDPQAEPLTWAPLKGMAHYPCLRKIQRLADAGPGMREVAGSPTSQAPALAALLSYVEQSEFDDIDALKIDFRTLPRYQFTTTSNECLRRKCPFYGKLCFAHGSRRRAESADIMVTNHTLLFCDVAADGGLLPTARHWVIDEAHSTEEEARAAFGSAITDEELERLAYRVSAAAGARGIFTRAERSVSSSSDEMLTQFFGLLAKARASGEAFSLAAREYMQSLKQLLFFDPSSRTRKGQSYERVDIWINSEVRSSEVFADVAGFAMALVETADRLIHDEQNLVGLLEGLDEAAVAQREIASHAMELREVRNAAELIFSTDPATASASQNYVFQATLNRKKDRYTDVVQALLLDVGEKMNETLFARTQSVVFASATISVNGSFKAFEQAVGLGQGEFSQVSELQLDSSFDFDNNMIVYVVSDMPEPNDPHYPEALNRLLVEAHRANGGSMLTLFTNRREMERSYEEVAPELKEDDLRVVCQKWGVSVKGLRDDFLHDERLSLFALKSFWEGFDAPGSTLRGVVITKLPFARPTDPLYCERASRDDRAWWHYVLPQAVIETKQAAGRLIRRADDRGVLILADKRLMTKAYGDTFLKSLQSSTVRFGTIDEIASALRMMNL